MNKMHEEGIVFQSEQQMGEFFKTSHGCVQQYENKKKNPRKIKPWELSERGMIGGMPAMVAGNVPSQHR